MSITLINRDTLTEKLENHRLGKSHRIFNVTFKRARPSKCGTRKAGDEESLNCMFGVKKHLLQEDGSYREPKHLNQFFNDHKMIGVYAVSRKATIPGAKTQGGIGFRSIRLDTITGITIDGQRYEVRG